MLTIQDFSSQISQMISLTRELVELESPTAEKAAVDRLGQRIAQELAQLGAEVETVAQPAVGNQIIGRWNAAATGGEIFFLSHIDTVHPLGTLVQNPCRQEDDRLYGPGTQDMKGGVALLFSALRRLKELGQFPNRPVTALFTTDEEAGSEASRTLIENMASRASLTCCLEPCLAHGALKTWRKGVGGFMLRTHGKASHAGANHAGGINAIEELAHQVLTIQKMTDYPLGTTLSVGVIQGGTVSNVVPEDAWAEVDFRVTSQGEAERITQQVLGLKPVLPGASLEVTGGLNRPPMERDARMIATFQKAQTIGEKLGLALTEGGTGGGSDANFVAPLGVSVLDGLGVYGDGQHSLTEYLEISRLPERAALLAAIITEW